MSREEKEASAVWRNSENYADPTAGAAFAKIAKEEKLRKNKFHAEKTVFNGEKFDSKKEAARYAALILLQKAGRISNLRRQVPYELIPAQYEPDTLGPRGGRKRGKLLEKSCCYVADFVYDTADGLTVVEDTKGVKTPEYIIKRKLMLHKYGIRVKEV